MTTKCLKNPMCRHRKLLITMHVVPLVNRNCCWDFIHVFYTFIVVSAKLRRISSSLVCSAQCTYTDKLLWLEFVDFIETYWTVQRIKISSLSIAHLFLWMNIYIYICIHDNIYSNICNWQKKIRLTQIKYLDIIINRNLRWNIYI